MTEGRPRIRLETPWVTLGFRGSTKGKPRVDQELSRVNRGVLETRVPLDAWTLGRFDSSGDLASLRYETVNETRKATGERRMGERDGSAVGGDEVAKRQKDRTSRRTKEANSGPEVAAKRQTPRRRLRVNRLSRKFLRNLVGPKKG